MEQWAGCECLLQILAMSQTSLGFILCLLPLQAAGCRASLPVIGGDQLSAHNHEHVTVHMPWLVRTFSAHYPTLVHWSSDYLPNALTCAQQEPPALETQARIEVQLKF